MDVKDKAAVSIRQIRHTCSKSSSRVVSGMCAVMH
jgi:hypothetical protein